MAQSGGLLSEELSVELQDCVCLREIFCFCGFVPSLYVFLISACSEGYFRDLVL